MSSDVSSSNMLPTSRQREIEIKENNQHINTVTDNVSIHNFTQLSTNNIELQPQLKALITTFKSNYITLKEKGAEVRQEDMLNYLNIPKTTLDLVGGYNKLVQDAIDEYAHKYITKDVRKKLNELRTETGKFPKRETIVTKKIFTETEMRKISRVVTTDKIRIMAFIQQFCDKMHYELENTESSDVIEYEDEQSPKEETINKVTNE
jgi:preprotein translocase subunit SecD